MVGVTGEVPLGLQRRGVGLVSIEIVRGMDVRVRIQIRLRVVVMVDTVNVADTAAILA